MSGIGLAGVGAVSPAGWGVPALRDALERGTPLPATPVARRGGNGTLPVHEVPRLLPAPSWMTHPRLRRASAITQYAVSAVIEARTMAGEAPESSTRLGLILCLLSGCVQYTERFFAEVLRDPPSASPLLFPETVFNAPASHVAAVLGQPPLTCTLLGDPAVFLQGLELAAQWLIEERVHECFVVGAEETNWLLADALAQFDPHLEPAGGAGAILLGASPERPLGVELCQVTDLEVYTRQQPRDVAAHRMRALLPPGAADELLCDSRLGCARLDAVEATAWRDWPGTRSSPKQVLGEGLMAASAWQCVAAVDALRGDRYRAAHVSVVGQTEAAAGARFARART